MIVVHPWGIDDGQGWRTPEPAGVAFQCTPAKNRIVLDHAATVINPLLKRLRGKARLVAYSLPGTEDPVRKKIYRSFRRQPDEEERKQGRHELEAALKAFTYRGQAVPASMTISTDTPTIDYFRQFPGLDAGRGYDGAGFWDLPIPVMKSIDVHPRDVVIYDGEGYPAVRQFLKSQGIRHVLLAGYNTDMCVCSTTAGYKNLAQDFDVFLVGDATIATFPAQPTPRFATTSSVCFARLTCLSRKPHGSSRPRLFSPIEETDGIVEIESHPQIPRPGHPARASATKANHTPSFCCSNNWPPRAILTARPVLYSI